MPGVMLTDRWSFRRFHHSERFLCAIIARDRGATVAIIGAPDRDRVSHRKINQTLGNLIIGVG